MIRPWSGPTSMLLGPGKGGCGSPVEAIAVTENASDVPGED